MSEHSELVKKEAERIRREIDGGLIFGETIDDDDSRLVAAYHCGVYMQSASLSTQDFTGSILVGRNMFSGLSQ